MKLLKLFLSARNRKIRPLSLLVISIFFSIVMLVVTPAALALPVAAVEWGSAPEHMAEYSYTFGFSFSIDADLWVTHLGVYDSEGDGLKKPHDVGLWNSDGSILKATATVNTGFAGELDGHFRYTEITPVKLDAGNYVVGAYWTKNHDPYAYNPESINYNPHVKYLDDALIATNKLEFPGQTYAPPSGSPDIVGWFGANFKLLDPKSVPVPEPQTMLLLGIGLIGVAGVGRRKLKSS